MDDKITLCLQNCKTTEELYSSFSKLKDLYFYNPDDISDKLKGVFIEDILKVMEERNISKKTLAVRLGKSKKYIKSIFNETADFNVKSIAEIAYALNMDVEIRLIERKTEDELI